MTTATVIQRSSIRTLRFLTLVLSLYSLSTIFILTSSQTVFAQTGTASLGNFVWEDTDMDGIQLSNFGENPIPGVRVTLYHSNGLLAGIRTTNDSGYYAFARLAPGEYYLSFEFPRGMVPTKQHQGSDSDLDSDVDQITGLTAPFTLEAGEDNQRMDAGFTHSGSVLSVVWADQNLNGVRDAGEPGVPATVVTLYDDNGAIIQSVPTDVRGNFEFPIITPGTYTFEFSPPPGMSFTQQGVLQSSAFNSNADPRTGRTELVQVTSGPNNFDWGAGLVVLAPTALEQVAEPEQPIVRSEQNSMALFLPFIGAADSVLYDVDAPFLSPAHQGNDETSEVEPLTPIRLEPLTK